MTVESYNTTILPTTIPGYQIELTYNNRAITKLSFVSATSKQPSRHSAPPFTLLAQAEIERYFAGQPIVFSLPISLSTRSLFSQKVLTALLGVPYGSYVSYSQLAALAGLSPAKHYSQAVGQVVSRNPLPLIIPCHRVVRQDNTLGGFSCGPKIKLALLAIEGISLPTT